MALQISKIPEKDKKKNISGNNFKTCKTSTFSTVKSLAYTHTKVWLNFIKHYSILKDRREAFTRKVS